MRDLNAVREQINGPVFPVLVPFTADGAVDYSALRQYARFLIVGGARVLMLTAGTSRLNLLSTSELVFCNAALVDACRDDALAIVAGPVSGGTAANLAVLDAARDAGALAALVIYPERWYGDSGVVEFFADIAANTDLGLLIHAMPMRDGFGGVHDTVALGMSMLEQIADLPNVIGVKEENGDRAIYDSVLNLLGDRLAVIGAGGAMRRFIGDYELGARTYLVGVESFLPAIGVEFHAAVVAGQRSRAVALAAKHEDPYFGVAVDFGWHRSLKETLAILGLMPPYERQPFPRMADDQCAILADLVREQGWMPESAVVPKPPYTGTYLIAEMACAHDGSVETAKALVDAAATAGCDAIQLQFYSVRDLLVPTHDVYELCERIQLDRAQWQEVIDHARSVSIDVFACTYDLPSVKLAIDLGVDGIKINSSDLAYPELLEAVASSGLPFTLGTGASTSAEIQAAVDTCRENGAANFVLMHGVQDFPTDIEDAHMGRLRELHDRFEAAIGYHDHTSGDDPFALAVDLIAIGIGVSVLEKHITLERAAKGPDYQAALEPAELAAWVRHIRRADLALGCSDLDELTDSDRRYRRFQKKNIVAACEIDAGTVIVPSMLQYLRAGEGLSPAESSKILGARATHSLARHTPITVDDVQLT